MSSLTNFMKVHDFNISFGIGRSSTPDDKLFKLRWDLIQEESDELLDALTKKDYIEILAGGILKSHEFNNPNCQEIISTGSWTRSNNTITISYPSQPNVNGEILELTTTTLKTKFISMGIIDVEVFTRIP